MSQTQAVDDAGWWPGAQRIESPNCDARPHGMQAELLVIHSISLPPGVFGGPAVVDLFTNRLDTEQHPSFRGLEGLRVSAHFLIRRDGNVIQFVSCDKRAWHAGQSSFEGRTACNDFSIGVELEGLDSMAFEPAQYATLLTLGRSLIDRYPLIATAGHSEIAPGRKIDPGHFFAWEDVVGSGLLPLRRIRTGWDPLARGVS